MEQTQKFKNKKNKRRTTLRGGAALGAVGAVGAVAAVADKDKFSKQLDASSKVIHELANQFNEIKIITSAFFLANLKESVTNVTIAAAPAPGAVPHEGGIMTSVAAIAAARLINGELDVAPPVPAPGAGAPPAPVVPGPIRQNTRIFLCALVILLKNEPSIKNKLYEKIKEVEAARPAGGGGGGGGALPARVIIPAFDAAITSQKNIDDNFIKGIMPLNNTGAVVGAAPSPAAPPHINILEGVIINGNNYSILYESILKCTHP